MTTRETTSVYVSPSKIVTPLSVKRPEPISGFKNVMDAEVDGSQNKIRGSKGQTLSSIRLSLESHE